MVFSFFKKQPNKMPERPAARPRPHAEPGSTRPPQAERSESGKSLEELSSLDFPAGRGGVGTASGKLTPGQEPAAQDDFSIDDFDDAFTNSDVMGIDIDHDADPLQVSIEQVVVLYANGQDAAARSLLETFVKAYPGVEGKRFWLLLFDLLQIAGDRAAFEKLGVDYAQACETSPPTWSKGAAAKPEAAGGAGEKVFLQGVLTVESILPVDELARLIDRKSGATVDCSKLIGCDDEVAARLAELLARARKQRLAVELIGVEPFMERLNERLNVGEAAHEPIWRLLLELLQRQATQERFEERAVDYAVTFELSPPSWETPPAKTGKPPATDAVRDEAHYLSGEIKNCRFDDLPKIIEESTHPILDFSGVTRLDFVSAGQLVNRLAALANTGKEVVIRSPNHFVAELMAVVGLNKLARIIVPKS